MPVIVDTSKLKPSLIGKMTANEKLWIYNGLDCCVTKEVYNVISKQLDENTRLIYNWEKALMAPSLEMTLRGIKVDLHERNLLIREYETRQKKLLKHINILARAIWGKELNPNSPKQLKEFFYEFLGLPKQYAIRNGARVVSTDRDCLQKLQMYPKATQFTKRILAFRDVTKFIQTLKTSIDPDNRFRAAYNVAGTDTGRWSSSSNAFGTGGNAQNITDQARIIFVTDPGYKLCYMDLEQAESRAIAYLSGDENYIEACESGDLHTYVCRMVWPDLGWTGNLKDDRKIADQIFYRHFTYRDMSKRGGHGTNYMGKPPTIAKHLQVPVELIEAFQERYFERFPKIKSYHRDIAIKLQTEYAITTPLGRKRIFWNRHWDDATLRSAVAFVPQSLIAEILNVGLYLLWEADLPGVQILAQVHDAILFQYSEDLNEAELIKKVQQIVQIPVEVNGRVLKIPTEASVGWNWAKRKINKTTGEVINPDGLLEFQGEDNRVRQNCPGVNLLDRRVR